MTKMKKKRTGMAHFKNIGQLVKRLLRARENPSSNLFCTLGLESSNILFKPTKVVVCVGLVGLPVKANLMTLV